MFKMALFYTYTQAVRGCVKKNKPCHQAAQCNAVLAPSMTDMLISNIKVYSLDFSFSRTRFEIKSENYNISFDNLLNCLKNSVYIISCI